MQTEERNQKQKWKRIKSKNNNNFPHLDIKTKTKAHIITGSLAEKWLKLLIAYRFAGRERVRERLREGNGEREQHWIWYLEWHWILIWLYVKPRNGEKYI